MLRNATLDVASATLGTDKRSKVEGVYRGGRRRERSLADGDCCEKLGTGVGICFMNPPFF